MERWNPDEYVANFHDVVNLYHIFLANIIKWVEIKGNTFLELGCGSGKWSALFACLGFQCALVDNTEGMFDRVRKNFPMISKSFYFIFDDALVLKNVPVDMFDIVFSEGLYEHFLEKGDRMKFVFNTFSVLKEGGIAIIMIPYKTGKEDEIQIEVDELLNEWSQIFKTVKRFQFFDNKTKECKFIGVIAKKEMVVDED